MTQGDYPTSSADGSRTLYSERYAQTFHSDKGAVSESRHVFVEGSGVGEHLRKGISTSVLEVGFGTGLNFFLSADLALEARTPLAYTSLEQTLLPSGTVHALDYAAYLQHAELIESYLAFRNTLSEQVEPGRYVFEHNTAGLELLIGEATEQRLPRANFDAVYHDAFSPDANPELWTEAFLGELFTALKPGGSLSTYTVKGEVRRRLAGLGFTVEKQPGPPGGKREMLLARKPITSPETADATRERRSQ